MKLPPPWNLLENDIEKIQDYDAGAEKLAQFFVGTEERHPPDDLLVALGEAEPSRDWLERFCLSLLHIEPAHAHVGRRALQAKRLHRTFQRIEVGSAITPHELKMAKTIRDGLALGSLVDFQEAVGRARVAFEGLLKGTPLTDPERDAMLLLIECEAKALRERVDWLSENVDPYDMKVMTRVLPRLRIYDELVQGGIELAKRFKNREPVGIPVMTLSERMKASSFDKWWKSVRKRPELAQLTRILSLQLEKKIASSDLIALSTLCRWTGEAMEETPSPLDCLESALSGYDDGIFTLATEVGAKMLMGRLTGSGAKVYRDRIEVDLRHRAYSQWVGKNMLSIPYYRGDEAPTDIRTLINQNLTRDSILEGLLNNPKVYQAPGVVAHVAAVCRSVTVLTTIAKSKHLYSGFANRDVPLTLLQNPCNIPMTVLRPLINARYIGRLDLKHLSRNRAGVRREVQTEAENYLRSIA